MHKASPPERDSRLPFTVLLADAPGQPIEIHDHSVGLHMVLVEKSSVHRLNTDWDVTGVYLLLDLVQADGSFGAYVGKSPAGVRSRLHQHEREKSWNRALLIRRATLHGLTSAQAGWLEGDLHELMRASERAVLSNSVTPGDDTVPSYDQTILESFRDPIVRVLRLLGYETESVDSSSPAGGTQQRRSNKYAGIQLADLIGADLLHAGDRLISVNSSWPASASVNSDGTISCNATSYASPSAAAAAVRGGAANGWDFWAVEGPGKSVRLATLREQYFEQREAEGSDT
ncbi:hypothetical protein [Micrococcus luteus]|uniref:restriction system modified-DNA reader domain-containing protein n=1 Tax=Micrococcus luteus TaxID=1270 RepID=UPI003429D506